MEGVHQFMVRFSSLSGCPPFPHILFSHQQLHPANSSLTHNLHLPLPASAPNVPPPHSSLTRTLHLPLPLLRRDEQLLLHLSKGIVDLEDGSEVEVVEEVGDGDRPQHQALYREAHLGTSTSTAPCCCCCHGRIDLLPVQ